MDTKKATGQRGSWFAKVDGVSLPCVHRYWLKGMEHHDPFRRHEGQEKIDEFVAAITGLGKVILTDDEPSFDARGEVIGFDRKRYIAVFEVSDVLYDQVDGLRFRLSKRLHDLK